MFQHFARAFSMLLALFVVSNVFSLKLMASPQPAEPDCASCHQPQVLQWQKSHHAKAMLPAAPENILADFNDTSASHYSQHAMFSRKDNKYFAKVWNEKSEPELYQVIYVFGFNPLQQYLVQTTRGQLQVLPFAWDTRDKSDGGQRWMHLYNEDITPQDRLHWLQPLQNWNGMCADCHSDDLKRNYDVNTDTFNTHFSNVNVSCASCHDDVDQSHYAKRVDKTTALNNDAMTHSTHIGTSHWFRPEGADTAYLEGGARDNKFMESCFACHALRSPLTDGFSSDKPFLDQFNPTLPNAPIYQVDGHLNEEAYIYGSFLQSKMHQRGVNCLDCHKTHSMELKFEGNAVCTQCHSAEKFDQPLHHGHKQKSQGAQCKNCHMPAVTYMQVDARHDHSFKIPRPELTVAYEAPNACQSCHTDKDAEWAVTSTQKIRQLDGVVFTQPLSENQHHLLRLQSGGDVSYTDHLAIVKDKSIPVIRRSGALALFEFSPRPISPDDAMEFILSKEPLLRLAVIAAMKNHSESVKVAYLASMLEDSLLSVRVSVAAVLAGLNVPKNRTPALQKALGEWLLATQQMQFRGEAHVNEALVAQARKNLTHAEESYLRAIKVDPYFEPPYINLADLYRSTDKPQSAAVIYQKGINALPNSAILHYGYGLHFVRQKDLAAAVVQLKKSHTIAPANSQYAYLYFLALHTHGEKKRAYCGLRRYIQSQTDRSSLIELLQSFQADSPQAISCP